MAGKVSWGWSQNKWTGATYVPGSNASFHSFLAGPCVLQDQKQYEQATVYGYGTFEDVTTTIMCNASSTCTGPSPQHTSPQHTRSAEYLSARAVTDAEYAIKVAQNLVSVSAAFASTNEPATTDLPVPPSPPRVSLRRPYKALVILYMGGGVSRTGSDPSPDPIPRDPTQARILSHGTTQARI